MYYSSYNHIQCRTNCKIITQRIPKRPLKLINFCSILLKMTLNFEIQKRRRPPPMDFPYGNGAPPSP